MEWKEKEKRLTEVIDAEVISAVSAEVKKNEERLKVIEDTLGEVKTTTYDVTVTTKFQVTGPSADQIPDPRMLEKALWESMPAGYIGGELFVKFPTGSRNFNVQIKATEAALEAASEPVAETREEEGQ